jgi:Bacterial TSP3 repeat
LSAIQSYSDAQLTELVKALAAMPLIWPTNFPDGGEGLTYWSLSHPSWPPLPSSFGAPVWDLSPATSSTMMSADSTSTTAATESSFLVVDDVDYPPAPGGTNDDGGTNVYTPPVIPLFTPTTNDLWLQITGTTNTGTSITAYIIVHPPWNMTGEVWDIFATTNLAPSAWQWVYRTAPGQTNVTITGLAYPNEFFTAASTNDADGDGLSDAFETLVSHTDPNAYSTDGSGMSDGWEWQYFGSVSNNPSADPDGDGLTTYQEWQMRSANYNPDSWDSNTNGVSDGYEDYSGDGLANLLEASFGGNMLTNSLSWREDSDSDGLPDSYETMNGLDPNVAQPAPGLPTYSKDPIQ